MKDLRKEMQTKEDELKAEITALQESLRESQEDALKNEIEIVEKLSLPGGNNFKVNAIATIGDENIRSLEALRTKGELQDLPIADARKEGGRAILLDAVLSHLKKEYQYDL